MSDYLLIAKNGLIIESSNVRAKATISIATYFPGISYLRPIENGTNNRL